MSGISDALMAVISRGRREPGEGIDKDDDDNEERDNWGYVRGQRVRRVADEGVDKWTMVRIKGSGREPGTDERDLDDSRRVGDDGGGGWEEGKRWPVSEKDQMNDKGRPRETGLMVCAGDEERFEGSPSLHLL